MSHAGSYRMVIVCCLYHFIAGRESYYRLHLNAGHDSSGFVNTTFQEYLGMSTFSKCAVQCHNSDCVAFTFDRGEQICKMVKSPSEPSVNMGEVYIKQSMCHQLPSWRSSGVYSLTTSIGTQYHTKTAVCDTDTLGGGWTVLQNRFDGEQDFYKGWEEYKNGFGDPSGDYWIGNEIIYLLTSTRPYVLYIEMVDFDDVTKSVSYDGFHLQPESDKYRLSISGFHGTDITNSMTYHNNCQFTTYDSDNDAQTSQNCAISNHGAWWYNKCHKVNLNGERSNETYQMSWKNFYPGTNIWTPIKRSKMMIRPMDYTVV